MARLWQAGAPPIGAGVAGGLRGCVGAAQSLGFALGPAWHVWMCVFQVALAGAETVKPLYGRHGAPVWS